MKLQANCYPESNYKIDGGPTDGPCESRITLIVQKISLPMTTKPTGAPPDNSLDKPPLRVHVNHIAFCDSAHTHESCVCRFDIHKADKRTFLLLCRLVLCINRNDLSVGREKRDALNYGPLRRRLFSIVWRLRQPSHSDFAMGRGRDSLWTLASQISSTELSSRSGSKWLEILILKQFSAALGLNFLSRQNTQPVTRLPSWFWSFFAISKDAQCHFEAILSILVASRLLRPSQSMAKRFPNILKNFCDLFRVESALGLQSDHPNHSNLIEITFGAKFRYSYGQFRLIHILCSRWGSLICSKAFNRKKISHSKENSFQFVFLQLLRSKLHTKNFENLLQS